MQHNKLNILLIEDDRLEILKLKKSISEEFNDCILTLANNGKEALSKLKTDSPDLILLDLNSPNTNGIEFLKNLKDNEDLKHIPVIILTASNNDDDISECYRLGIAGYVLKPIKYEDYEAKIKAIFRYWSLNEFLRI